MVCTGIFICIIILLLWRVLLGVRWSVQVGSYTTVISIDVITEGVETRKGFRGPPTAEIAADLKWLHVSVEESYMTNVICDSFTTKFEARRTVKQTHDSRSVGENTPHCVYVHSYYFGRSMYYLGRSTCTHARRKSRSTPSCKFSSIGERDCEQLSMSSGT